MSLFAYVCLRPTPTFGVHLSFSLPSLRSLDVPNRDGLLDVVLNSSTSAIHWTHTPRSLKDSVSSV